MSKVREPESRSNSSAVKGSTKQKKGKQEKKGRLIQQRAHNRQKEQTLNKGADTDIQLLECKLSVLLFPSVAAAYITHVPHVQQLYSLLSREESVM